MESIISSFHVKTLVLIVFIILVVMLVFAFVKRLIGLIIISICLIVVYAGYLIITGQRLPITGKEVIQHGIEQFQKIKGKGGISPDTLMNKSDPGARKKNP